MSAMPSLGSNDSAVKGTLQDPPFRFQEMHLELTTACNFRCEFCPLSELGRPAARLEYEIVARLLRECVEQKLTRQTTFHLMGEALLHPQCVDILGLCRDLGIRTRLVTNGSLFHEDKFSRMFKLLDRLDISFRTLNDMELQVCSNKLTFQQYLEKLLATVRLRDGMHDSTTTVRIRVFVAPHTIPSLRTLCESLKVDPDLVGGLESAKVPSYEEIRLTPWLSFLCERKLDWLNRAKRFPSSFGNCNEFEIGFAVLASGDVTTCCWDAHGGNVLGNVEHQSLREILFSQEAEAFRRSFRRHKCPTETCSRCLGRPTLAKSIAYQALVLLNRR